MFYSAILPDFIKSNTVHFAVVEGDDTIQEFEGCSLKAYQGKADKPGLYTIGWGTIRYENGKSVQKNDVITQERANELLLWEVNQECVPAVNAMLQDVFNPTQGMFDALVSFRYNVGGFALETSTLYKKMKVNPHDPNIWKYDANNPVDSCQFLRWVRSNGKVWKGLIRRRMAEANLYNSK